MLAAQASIFTIFIYGSMVMISRNKKKDLSNSRKLLKFNDKFYTIINIARQSKNYHKNSLIIASLQTEFEKTSVILFYSTIHDVNNVKIIYRKLLQKLNELCEKKIITKDDILKWRKRIGIEKKIIKADMHRLEKLPLINSDYLRSETEKIHITLTCSYMSTWDTHFYNTLQVKLYHLDCLVKVHHALNLIQEIQKFGHMKESKCYDNSIKILFENMKHEFSNKKYFKNPNALDAIKQAKRTLRAYQEELLQNPDELNKALTENPLNYSVEVKEALISKMDKSQLILDSKLSEKQLGNLFVLNETKAEYFIRGYLKGASSLYAYDIEQLQQGVPGKHILLSALVASPYFEKSIKEIAESLDDAELVTGCSKLVESEAGRTKLSLLFESMDISRISRLIKNLDKKSKRLCLNQCIDGKITQTASVETKQHLAGLALEEYLQEVSELKSSLAPSVFKDPTSMLYRLYSREECARQVGLAAENGASFIQKVSSFNINIITEHNAGCYGNMLLSLIHYPESISTLQYAQLTAITEKTFILAKSKKWVTGGYHTNIIDNVVEKFNQLIADTAQKKSSISLNNQFNFLEIVVLNMFLMLNERNKSGKFIYTGDNRKEIIHKLIKNFDKSASSILNFIDNNPYLKIAKDPIIGWQFINMMLDDYSSEKIQQLHQRTKNFLAENVGGEANLDKRQRTQLIQSFSIESLVKIVNRTRNILLLEDILNSEIHRKALFENNHVLFDEMTINWDFTQHLKILEEKPQSILLWLRAYMLMRPNLIRELINKNQLLEQINLISMKLDVRTLIILFKSIYALHPDNGWSVFLRILNEKRYAELREYREQWQDAINIISLDDCEKILLSGRSNASYYLIYLLFCNKININKILNKPSLFKKYIDFYLSKPIDSFKLQDLNQLDARVQYRIFTETNFMFNHTNLTIGQMIEFGSNLEAYQWAIIITKYLIKLISSKSCVLSRDFIAMLFNRLNEIAPLLSYEEWGNVLAPLAAMNIMDQSVIPDSLVIRIISQRKAFQQLENLGCLEEFFDIKRLFTMSPDEIKKIDYRNRLSLFKRHSVLLKELEIQDKKMSLSFIKALTHGFNSGAIASIIKAYEVRSADEQKYAASINMTAINILFGADPFVIANGLNNVNPLYSKQMAFCLLEELSVGIWSPEEKRLSDDYAASRDILDFSHLSGALAKRCLIAEFGDIDSRYLSVFRNKHFADYIQKHWNDIVKGNKLETLEALIKNPHVLSKLSDEQFILAISTLEQKGCTPQQYQNLIAFFKQNEKYRNLLIVNIPKHLEKLNDDQFSFYAIGPITHLIQTHCCYLESINNRQSIDIAFNWFNRLDSNTSARKRAAIINAVYSHDEMKIQLVNHETKRYSAMIKEKIKRTSIISLGVELYSITDKKFRIKFAKHIFKNLFKAHSEKYAEILALIKPIIKLSQCSWYNFFNRWFYGKKEEKNRANYMKNFKPESCYEDPISASYSSINASLKTHGISQETSRKPIKTNNKKEAIRVSRQWLSSFYHAADALNETANDLQPSRATINKLG